MLSVKQLISNVLETLFTSDRLLKRSNAESIHDLRVATRRWKKRYLLHAVSFKIRSTSVLEDLKKYVDRWRIAQRGHYVR